MTQEQARPATESAELPEKTPSVVQTPDSAREVLVEHLAEALQGAEVERYTAEGPWVQMARAVLPVVAAQVEAAVSVARAEARAEVERNAVAAEAAIDHANVLRMTAEADLRALREGLEALHRPWYEVNGVRHDHVVPVYGAPPKDHVCRVGFTTYDNCLIDPESPEESEHYVLACSECRCATEEGHEGYLFWPCPTIALLAPSPAEGTGEARLNCPVCGSGEEGDCVCGPRDRCICNDPPVAREVVCRLHPNAHLATPAPVSSGGCCGDYDEDCGRPCINCPERAPSPAEGTGEALTFGPCANCGHGLDDHLEGLACYAGTTVTSEFACDCAEWIAPDPVSSGEARDPANPCRCHPADDDSGHCGGWMPPAPVVTPSAEDGA